MFVWCFMFYVQQVYQAKEVVESNVQIKQALCATIIDTDRVCLGTEDGLFCIELMKESKLKPRNMEPNENALTRVLTKVNESLRRCTESWRAVAES